MEMAEAHVAVSGGPARGRVMAAAAPPNACTVAAFAKQLRSLQGAAGFCSRSEFRMWR
jgi:hypothetical protein